MRYLNIYHCYRPDRVPSLPSYHVPRPTGDGGRESRIMGAEGVSSPPGTLERRKKPAAMATENTTTKQKSKSSPKPRVSIVLVKTYFHQQMNNAVSYNNFRPSATLLNFYI